MDGFDGMARIVSGSAHNEIVAKMIAKLDASNARML